MAINYIGGTSGTVALGTSLTLTYTPVPGNEVFIVVSISGSRATLGVCQDNNSNALTAVPGPFSQLQGIFYGIAQAGATSYTISFTNAAAAAALTEYSGEAGAYESGVNSAGSNTSPNLTVTTSYANSLIAAGISISNGPITFSSATGNLRQQATLTGASVAIVDNLGTIVGSSVTNSATLSANGNWVVQQVEIYPPFTPIALDDGYGISFGTVTSGNAVTTKF